MKAEEIKIGNLVKWSGCNYKVLAIANKMVKIKNKKESIWVSFNWLKKNE